MSDDYTIAVICKNGHIVNAGLEKESDKEAEYCPICGAETIVKCQQEDCGAFIHVGDEEKEDTAPDTCPKCGQSFPWTKEGSEE